MAKVINPLLSGSASGQLGHMMVFLKTGVVRQYVVPSNPKTVAQMLQRNSMGDLQRELKDLGPVLRAELKTAFGPRWNSSIIGELLANGGAALATYTAEFTAFTGGEKTAWETADHTTPVELVDGAVLYACASAAFDMAARIGVELSLTLPASSTATTTGTEWRA